MVVLVDHSKISLGTSTILFGGKFIHLLNAVYISGFCLQKKISLLVNSKKIVALFLALNHQFKVVFCGQKQSEEKIV